MVPVIDSAKSGMNKLSMAPDIVFVGTTFRGMDMAESKVHALFVEGSEFSDAGFMSSSLEKGSAFDGKAQITIKSKTGVKIQDVSVFDNEKEVLFKPGTKFDVAKKTQDKDGNWHIELEEKS